jgi:hypothetical protein
METLTSGQYDLVSNLMSLTVAAMVLAVILIPIAVVRARHRSHSDNDEADREISRS